MSYAAAAVDRTSPASDKVALFTSLFRGRSVDPRRFESRKTGMDSFVVGKSPTAACTTWL
jgi:hypothetical protein